MWEWILNLLSRPPAICRHTRHIATILQSLPILLGMAELGLLHVNTRFPFLSHIFNLLFDFFSRIAFFRITLLLVFDIDIVIVQDNICVLFLFL